ERTFTEQLDRFVIPGQREWVWREVFGCCLTNVGNCSGMQRPSEDWGGEWRHGCRLDLSIELLVISQESFVMAAVTRFSCAVDRDDQPGADVGTAADPAGYLDILCRSLWLSNDGH